MTIDEAIQHLQDKSASLRSGEVRKLLEGFGYRVKTTRKGHCVVQHPQLVKYEFFTLNYSPGHGGETVKPIYVNRIRRHLEDFKEYLQEIGYE